MPPWPSSSTTAATSARSRRPIPADSSPRRGTSTTMPAGRCWRSAWALRPPPIGNTCGACVTWTTSCSAIATLPPAAILASPVRVSTSASTPCKTQTGTLLAIADVSGTVQERYRYTAYGTPTFLTSTFAPRNPNASAYAWDALYTGRQLDAETGLYQYRNRFYHAELGRFVNRDPIGYEGGTSLYEYVGGNPLIRTDPNGLRAPASAFQYIPGAVDWLGLNIDESDIKEGLGPLSSTVYGHFKSHPDQFKDNSGCSLCTELGVVQIATWDYIGHSSISTLPLSGHRDWFLDGGFPYKKITINPSAIVVRDSNGTPYGDLLIYTDAPNIKDTTLGLTTSFTESYSQHTEMHLMCTEGREKGAVYGGATWYHEFTYNHVPPFMGYIVHRPNPVRKNNPSQTFKDVVRQSGNGL